MSVFKRHLSYEKGEGGATATDGRICRMKAGTFSLSFLNGRELGTCLSHKGKESGEKM